MINVQDLIDLAQEVIGDDSIGRDTVLHCADSKCGFVGPVHSWKLVETECDSCAGAEGIQCPSCYLTWDPYHYDKSDAPKLKL